MKEPTEAAVRAAIAGYAHALDAGRTDDLVELFCPDGVSEIAGLGTFEGHEAIRAGYATMVPAKPQLHLVGNTVVGSRSGAFVTATSDLVFLQRGRSGWAVRLTGRYDDTLHWHDGRWRFARRVTTLQP